MRKIATVLRPWSEARPILIGQVTLLAGEAAVAAMILSQRRTVLLVAAALLLAAHAWSWRQLIWRHQDICALIRTMREIGP